MTENSAGGPMLVSEIAGHTNRIGAEPYVFVQPKLDGWCCMANTRTRCIYTRSGDEITNLPHINAALPTACPEWLHGELWKAGCNCDDVQSMVKRGDSSLEFHVFDCVSDEGFGARIVDVIETIAYIRARPYRLVQTYTIKPSDISEYYARFLSEGYEGMIIRLDGHPYYHGRSRNVFKMKPAPEVV